MLNYLSPMCQINIKTQIPDFIVFFLKLNLFSSRCKWPWFESYVLPTLDFWMKLSVKRKSGSDLINYLDQTQYNKKTQVRANFRTNNFGDLITTECVMDLD